MTLQAFGQSEALTLGVELELQLVNTNDYDLAHYADDMLRLMARRRAIRRRDGARNWALLRDLENPDHWSESYHIATWDEYVRHNLRRTKADAASAVSLRALHRGEGDPPVHRMIERQTSALPWSRHVDPGELPDALTDPTRST